MDLKRKKQSPLHLPIIKHPLIQLSKVLEFHHLGDKAVPPLRGSEYEYHRLGNQSKCGHVVLSMSRRCPCEILHPKLQPRTSRMGNARSWNIQSLASPLRLCQISLPGVSGREHDQFIPGPLAGATDIKCNEKRQAQLLEEHPGLDFMLPRVAGGFLELSRGSPNTQMLQPIWSSALASH